DRFFQAYRTFLARGASPEDAYFKLLEDGADGEPAPDWFGTRDGKFRQFLIQAHHSGVAIPTIRLRMQGNKEGEIVADPELMAWDLLQTAVNRMRGTVDKDVSPVAHEHNKDGYDSEPSVPFDRVDPRAMPQEECNGFLEWPENKLEGAQERELREPEESDSYYLNLALKSLNKADSTLGAIAGSKIHEAYTVAMDGIYRLGHLTMEQRIDLSSAITDALDAFHEGIGDMGDLEIPAEDVALLMKHCTDEFHLHAPDFEGPACKDGQGGVSKHKDKQGSTAHHQKGGGGVTAPPAVSGPQEEMDMQMEDRVQTLTAEIKDRNAKGANLRLSPGYRNAPYSVTGMDALQRPLRLVGNVADITQSLRENSAEVDEIMEQRKVDNYAVPIDIGKVNEVRIYEGDGVSPMDVVREQVARASFTSAVATVMKQPTRGWRARDYRIDDEQQVEPENVSVMGGVRVPGNRNQEGHATTEIEQGGDVEGISGTKINIPTEPLDTPPAAGIAQQGAISPPRGIQGVGEKPEFIQVHDDQPMHGVREENEGTGLDPRADADNRGAPVAHRTQRP
ncbi:hypothetical protein LCGC14_2217650, partial [marine sediment metagenome]